MLARKNTLVATLRTGGKHVFAGRSSHAGPGRRNHFMRYPTKGRCWWSADGVRCLIGGASAARR